MDPAKLIEVALQNGPLVLIIAILATLLLAAVRILMDEDRAAIFRATAYKALYAVSGKREFEKSYISNEIRGSLNQARKGIYYGSETIPKLSRIEWVDGTSTEAYDISDNEFVIRLDPFTSNM